MVRHKRGFTLIEMAVVLVIVGLVLATTLPLLTERIAKDKATKGVQSLNILKQEIIGFAITNKRLPDATEIQSFSGYEDVWDNAIAYYPATGLDTATITTATTTTDLTLRRIDASGTNNIADLAFIIVSRGPNVNLQINEDVGGALPARILQTYGPGYANFDSVDTVNTSNDIANSRPEVFDDVVDYVSLAYLQNKLATSDSASPTGGAGDGFGDGDGVASKIDTSGTGTASTRQNTLGTVTVDAFSNEMLLGNGLDSTRACVWYQATALTCGPDANGVYICDDSAWTNLRFIFRYEFLYEDDEATSGDYHGGFVFTVINADNNDDPADPPCGSGGGARASLMGYSYNGTTAQDPIGSPKFGVEIDLFRDHSGTAGGDNDRQDPDINTTEDAGMSNNHIAAVFWQGINMVNGNATVAAVQVDNLSGANDNTHGMYQNDDISETGFDYNDQVLVSGNQNWFEDKTEHWIRFELVRDDTGTTGNSSVNYTIYAWQADAPDATFLDISATMSGGADAGHYDYKIEDTATFAIGARNTVNSLMNKFRFGWTMASGDASYDGNVPFNDINIGQFDYNFN